MLSKTNTSEQTWLGVIWRRKWIVVVTVLVFGVVTALVSRSLHKVYATSSTLLVVQAKTQQSFDSVQAAQVVARTYGDILGSDTVAGRVAQQLNGSRSQKDAIRAAVSIETVPETQLIKVSAQDGDPRRAQQIANTYADEFISYGATTLFPKTQATVSLAAAAPKPDSPARPKPTLYTLLACLFGLAVGLGLAFLREQLDSRLQTFEAIERAFDVPVLARVPPRGKTDTSIAAFTEAFRVLRTNLQFSMAGGAPRTIAITSGDEGEGKSTTVSQLALVTAATSTNVLAVEADLRRPGLQRLLASSEREPLRPGLSNYLVGGADLEEIIHTASTAPVELVPAGPSVPSLSGLLESQRGHTVVDALASHADVTLFDCPPLGLGADAATVAGRVDGVILVVNMEHATEQRVRNAIRQIEAVRGRLLGLVLNRDRSVETIAYSYLEEADTTAPDAKALAQG